MREEAQQPTDLEVASEAALHRVRGSGVTQVAARIPSAAILTKAFPLNPSLSSASTYRPTPNRFPESVDDDLDRFGRTFESSDSDDAAMGSDVFSNRGDNDDISLHDEPTSVGTDNGFDSRRMGLWLGFRDRPSPGVSRGNTMEQDVGRFHFCRTMYSSMRVTELSFYALLDCSRT